MRIKLPFIATCRSCWLFSLFSFYAFHCSVSLNLITLDFISTEAEMKREIIHFTPNARHNKLILIKLHMNAIYVEHIIKLKPNEKKKRRKLIQFLLFLFFFSCWVRMTAILFVYAFIMKHQLSLNCIYHFFLLLSIRVLALLSSEDTSKTNASFTFELNGQHRLNLNVHFPFGFIRTNNC